jgi:hypothetical protein
MHLLVLSTLGCLKEEPSPAPAPEAVGPDLFWDAFHEARYEDAGTAEDALATDLEATPGDGELTLLLAHAQFWQLAEYERHPAPDPSEIPGLSMGAVQSFSAARALLPQDDRVSCWLGLIQMTVGRATGDPALVEQGAGELALATEAWPEFAAFCEVIAYQRDPIDTPGFQRAVDAAWTLLDSCYDTSVDRQNPDLTPYLDQQVTTGRKAVCWNGEKAPHNVEGLYLNLGDVLSRAGDAHVAEILYNNALLVDDGSWRYRELLEQKLTDVVARTELFRDDNPSNDPELGSDKFDCVLCHAN